MAESMAEAVVCRRRAMPMKMSLHRGRKGLPDAERELFDAIADATGGNGIPSTTGDSTARSSSGTRSVPAAAPWCG